MAVSAQTAMNPLVTAAPILPRDATSTFGWFNPKGETTAWTPFTYDPVVSPITSFGSFWVDWCVGSTTTGWCDIVTYCDDRYLYLAGGAIQGCSSEGESPSSCITELLYESFGAEDPVLSKLVCMRDWMPRKYYRTSPPGSEQTVITETATSMAIATTSSSNIPSTTDGGSSVSVERSPTEEPPSPVPTERTPDEGGSGDNTRIGIIAGCTVGGVAILGAIVLVALFIIRRTSRKHVIQGETDSTQPSTSVFSGGAEKDQGFDTAGFGQPRYTQMGSGIVEADSGVSVHDLPELRC